MEPSSSSISTLFFVCCAFSRTTRWMDVKMWSKENICIYNCRDYSDVQHHLRDYELDQDILKMYMELGLRKGEKALIAQKRKTKSMQLFLYVFSMVSPAITILFLGIDCVASVNANTSMMLLAFYLIGILCLVYQSISVFSQLLLSLPHERSICSKDNVHFFQGTVGSF